MNSELFIYIDESGTPSFSDNEAFSLGALISPKKIPNKIIRDALDKLENDKDLNKKDRETINRGFFHASFDSKNAHSYICEGISKIAYPCTFSVEILKKANTVDANKEGLQTNSKMHRHVFSLIAVHFLLSKIDKLCFFVAERKAHLQQCKSFLIPESRVIKEF
ncbi:MAG: hypothetical protein PVH61_24330 [Candidatus Aminicenantes bacterium]|jgi:hypothetical protein